MTRMLFRDDAYLTEATGTVTAHTPEGGLVLDATIFYPRGGGQPGDSGRIEWPGGAIDISTTLRACCEEIALVPAEPLAMPPVGTVVTQRLDWDRRHAHMRMHTALHLLSVVIPLPVTGGAVGSVKGRLDFAMPDPDIDKEALTARLNTLIDRDLVVSESWITDAELQANPGLVKTMSVMPPAGRGRVRLIHIADAAETVDLQPCGGTHVARTAEIGPVAIGKIENKGQQNRRVNLLFV